LSSSEAGTIGHLVASEIRDTVPFNLPPQKKGHRLPKKVGWSMVAYKINEYGKMRKRGKNKEVSVM
jgi:hypothetical protein